MPPRPISALTLIAICALAGALTSCVSRPAGVAETPGPVETEPSPSPTMQDAIPTGTESPPQPIDLGEVSILVPQYWYSAHVELERMDALIFVQQDPAVLEAFDEPDLALPLDFMAGALILTPLPDDSDAESMRESFLSEIPDLSADDLDALLLSLDQVGLIDYTMVEEVELLQAWDDTLADLPALVMDGTATFRDDLPPLLHVQLWLTWTEESFVAFYALAAEDAWPEAQAPLFAALGSLSIR